MQQQQLSCAWASPAPDPTGPWNRSQLVLCPFSLELRAGWSHGDGAGGLGDLLVELPGPGSAATTAIRLCPWSPSRGGRGVRAASRTQVEVAHLIPSSPESQAQVLGLHCSLGTAPAALPMAPCFPCSGLTWSQNLGVHAGTLLPGSPSDLHGGSSQHRSTQLQEAGHVSRTCRVLSCSRPKQSWQPCHAHRVHGLWSLWPSSTMRPL